VGDVKADVPAEQHPDGPGHGLLEVQPAQGLEDEGMVADYEAGPLDLRLFYRLRIDVQGNKHLFDVRALVPHLQAHVVPGSGVLLRRQLP
jgi:hypothetical protein